ncbi:hypothetical protein Tcan_17620 [Toxocara canis]|uniref:Uncharacterized protein n=1 Tax=Toxocara canis TaxID=6265 RepID=A0A0B2V968_TOXCA|nr:hypothetical protein Tcan_17620 [Toxocara canis]
MSTLGGRPIVTSTLEARMLSKTLLMLLLLNGLHLVRSMPMTQGTLDQTDTMERLYQTWMERRRNEMLERIKTEMAAPKDLTRTNEPLECASLWRPRVFNEPCSHLTFS